MAMLGASRLYLLSHEHLHRCFDLLLDADGETTRRGPGSEDSTAEEGEVRAWKSHGGQKK